MPKNLTNAAIDGVSQGDPIWVLLLGGAIVLFLLERVLHWSLKFRSRKSRPDAEMCKVLDRLTRSLENLEARTASHDESIARAVAKLSEATAELSVKAGSNSAHLALIESQILILMGQHSER